MDHSYFLFGHLTSNVPHSGAHGLCKPFSLSTFLDLWEVGCGSVEETLEMSVWKEVLLRKEEGEVFPLIS